MKLNLKEDRREWRKAALLSLIGPAVLIGVLRWTGVVSWKVLAAALALFALVALCACVRPSLVSRLLPLRDARGFFCDTTVRQTGSDGDFLIDPYSARMDAAPGREGSSPTRNAARAAIMLATCQAGGLA
jgi:hypothetical protein